MPKVAPEKLEKLMGVVQRIFGPLGTVRQGKGISLLSNHRPPQSCGETAHGSINTPKALVHAYFT